MVVGEHGPGDVLRGAGCGQVAGGREDRVTRVIGVGHAVTIGGDPVLVPGRGLELHPADRAGRGGAEVASVVALDGVDRCQHLPRNVVATPGLHVDRDQEGRRAGRRCPAGREVAQRPAERGLVVTVPVHDFGPEKARGGGPSVGALPPVELPLAGSFTGGRWDSPPRGAPDEPPLRASRGPGRGLDDSEGRSRWPPVTAGAPGRARTGARRSRGGARRGRGGWSWRSWGGHAGRGAAHRRGGCGRAAGGHGHTSVVLVLLGGGHTGDACSAGVVAAAGAGLFAGATCAGAEKTWVTDGCARALPFRADEGVGLGWLNGAVAEGREEE